MSEALDQEPEETVDDSSTEVESVVEDQTEETGDDEQTIASFSELAQHLNTDESFLNTLKVPVKVDGETAETTVADLISSYQIQEAAEKRLNDAKAKSQALDQELAQKREQAETSLTQSIGLVKLAEELFISDLKETDLQKLRAEDEQAYLIEKDRLIERRNVIEQAKAKIVEAAQSSLASGNQLDQATIADERAKMIEGNAELESAEARTRLGEYIMTQGFTTEDIASTADHRLYLLAEKARKYDELQAKSAETKKKLLTVPKLKAGSTEQPKASSADDDAATVLYG